MNRSPIPSQEAADAPRVPSMAVRRPLSLQLVTRTGGLLLVLALVVAALTFVQVRKATTEALEAEGIALAATLGYACEGLLDRGGLAEVQRIATNSATIGSVRKVLITDLESQVLASSDRMDLSRRGNFPWMQDFIKNGHWRPIIDSSDDNLLVITQPLHSGKFGGSSGLGVIGAIRVALDRTGGRAVAYRAASRVLSVSLGSYIVLSVLFSLVLRRLVVLPLHHLAGVAHRFREGERSLRSLLRTRDEIGLVSLAFDDMAQEVEASMARMEEEVSARTEALDRLTRTLDELKASTAERLKLAEMIRALSTPVIRVYHQVIVMPLIGDIDTERAQQIESSLLDGIEKHDARFIIMDLTGVPVVDAQVAEWLLRAKRASELLGAKVAFVGISARVARSMVHLDVELTDLVAYGNLQSGLLHALRSLGVELKRKSVGG